MPSKIIREDIDHAAEELARVTGLVVRNVSDYEVSDRTVVRIEHRSREERVTYVHSCSGTLREVWKQLNAAIGIHRLLREQARTGTEAAA